MSAIQKGAVDPANAWRTPLGLTALRSGHQGPPRYLNFIKGFLRLEFFHLVTPERNDFLRLQDHVIARHRFVGAICSALEHDSVYYATKPFIAPIGDYYAIPALELVDVTHMGTVVDVHGWWLRPRVTIG